MYGPGNGPSAVNEREVSSVMVGPPMMSVAAEHFAVAISSVVP